MQHDILRELEVEGTEALRKAALHSPRYEVVGERGEPLAVRLRGQREQFMLEVRAMPLGADD